MLEFRNIIKIYPGPLTALGGINLTLDTGLFGLLGPNGAGKTTLMKITAGLLEPTSGEIIWNDRNISTNSQEIWKNLGYLPQEFGFYPHLTGRAMLMHLLALKGHPQNKETKLLAGKLLEKVNLSFAADRKIKTYSGGMRQRLGIAQAIAGNPAILIVDEPTAGLDPEERRRFYGILAEIAENKIVLLSTHIVEDVAVLCPRFAILKQGNIIVQANPTEAREKLHGTIFEGKINRQNLPVFSSQYCITQSILYEGNQHIRIYEPARKPPAGFIPAPPTLEDAYFVFMKNGDVIL